MRTSLSNVANKMSKMDKGFQGLGEDKERTSDRSQRRKKLVQALVKELYDPERWKQALMYRARSTQRPRHNAFNAPVFPSGNSTFNHAFHTDSIADCYSRRLPHSQYSGQRSGKSNRQREELSPQKLEDDRDVRATGKEIKVEPSLSDMKCIMSVSRLFAKKHRPKGASKNKRIVASHYLKDGLSTRLNWQSRTSYGLTSPMPKSQIASEGSESPRHFRSGSPSPLCLCRLTKAQPVDPYQNITSKRSRKRNLSVVPSRLQCLDSIFRDKEKVDAEMKTLKKQLNAFAIKIDGYQNALVERVHNDMTTNMNDVSKGRTGINQMHRTYQGAKDDVNKILHNHAKNLVHIRKMGAKPFIWRWPHYKPPKVVEYLDKFLNQTWVHQQH